MDISPFQAVYPNLELIASAESFFGTVKSKYPDYAVNGFFHKSSKEGLYLYEIQTTTGFYTGIVGCTHIDEFANGKVLKHEKTLAYKEQNMMQLILHNRAMVKPILLAYEMQDKLNETIQKIKNESKPSLIIKFDEDKEVHSVWSINVGSNMSAITKAFKKISSVYIADGHHRAASAKAIYDADHTQYSKESRSKILSIYVSFDQLKIYDYNRVLEVFQGISPVAFMVELSKYCNLKRLKIAQKPRCKYEMTFYVQGIWYRAKWKSKVLKKYKGQKVLLDAELLNTYILGNICKIKNIRDDQRISYVSGTEDTAGIIAEVAKSPVRLGVCLFPVTKEELKSVAKAGLVLPPKSTWFEPRIKNGIVVREL